LPKLKIGAIKLSIYLCPYLEPARLTLVFLATFFFLVVKLLEGLPPITVPIPILDSFLPNVRFGVDVLVVFTKLLLISDFKEFNFALSSFNLFVNTLTLFESPLDCFIFCCVVISYTLKHHNLAINYK